MEQRRSRRRLAQKLATVIMLSSLEPQIIRDASLSELEGAGFRPARWLPLPDASAQLRPKREIAARLLALNGLFAFVCAPDAAVSDSRLEEFFARNDFTPFIAEFDRDILSQDRHLARSTSDVIGWKLENMWPLAWVLGWEHEPRARGEFIAEDVQQGLIRDFLPDFDATLESFADAVQRRSLSEVVALEDLFYCAHNAVRSAQLGQEETVPDGFHPVLNGGVIYEHRRALTWCLSPGVSWDETDLST